MIFFDDWTIKSDGEIIARQFDNLTRTLTVTGDIPSGWEWVVLVRVCGNMDIIPLSPVDGGLGVVLTAAQLSIGGYYEMQLRGTQGDLVRHSNVITAKIPGSLSGDKQWPTVPSEFTELERRVKADADRAEEAADRAENAGGGSGGSGADGGYYTPSVTQPTADTMRVDYAPSDDGMPSVAPVTVNLPAGAVGPKGERGERGSSGVYVGSGEMPADCNVQIDPDGEILTIDDIVNSVLAALPNGDEVRY